MFREFAGVQPSVENLRDMFYEWTTEKAIRFSKKKIPRKAKGMTDYVTAIKRS